MMNTLWKLGMTTLFVTSLLLVLAIVWEVPMYLGYEMPTEFAKLPYTLLIIVALATGIGGIWRSGVSPSSTPVVESVAVVPEVAPEVIPKETKPKVKSVK